MLNDALPPRPSPPGLWPIFLCFLHVGAQSFGGGTSAWIRNELVRKRGWLEERPFLAGLALCQIAPGPNSMNLAVFVGTNLRGVPGALSALVGLMLLPIAIVLVAGVVYLHSGALPWVQVVLGGVGAGAVGLMFATGLRISRSAIRSVGHGLVAAGVAIGIGILHAPLLPVLLVAFPVSWAVARRA
jgi:chromate transporter